MKIDNAKNMQRLQHFILNKSQHLPQSDALNRLVLGIAESTKEIARLVAKGALDGAQEKLDSTNVQGETQMQLDVLSNNVFIKALEKAKCVAGLVSEELDLAYPIDNGSGKSSFLVNFDPLDGSSNIAVNGPVGSIFSILKAADESIQFKDYLQPGTHQLAAGYALYGPATMLVLTIGKGTHGFTLDVDTQEYVLTHPAIRISPTTSEFAVNTSNERFWEPPVQRYIAECKAGSAGARGREFNMRWVASMVADVHRILMRGGVFIYPKDNKLPMREGRLRLLYEANPMSFIVEQAGGKSSTGRQRLMEVVPEDIHQRVPVVLGSSTEVELIEGYHREFDDSQPKLSKKA